jgi:hypothetical protein
MEWTRSETIGLASAQCTTCHGLGLRDVKRGKEAPCNCVLRSIFRACLRRFRVCIEKEKHLSQCTLHFTGGRERSMSWGRKDEEYIADFLLMTRRVLAEDEFAIFKFHHLLGADWRMCCRRLKMDRGNFFHAVYKMEARLGKAFREVEPYGLFPLDEYFHGATKEVRALTPPRQGPAPLQPPMAA